MSFIQRLGLHGLLSFCPDAKPFDLQPLNILIGPNGAGKTNIIEALELLRAAPTNLNDVFRTGGGIENWVWKGSDRQGNPISSSAMRVELGRPMFIDHSLSYSLEFNVILGLLYVDDEKLVGTNAGQGAGETVSYYRLNNGEPVITTTEPGGLPGGLFGNAFGRRTEHKLDARTLSRDQSILSQFKDPARYPELSWVGREFARITTFRKWTFGARSDLRDPQRADEPIDYLLPDARNLALVLNEIQRLDDRTFNSALKRFLPRYERTSTKVYGGTVQLFLHEKGLRNPIPSTRISDGTLRFLAILAALLAPSPPPLLCIEEPELGLHPDAVALLADLLEDASKRMQLIVTTHSEALLSASNNHTESVLVCENNGEGTTVKRLEADQLAVWLDDYRLGDLWRMGELGGNP